MDRRVFLMGLAGCAGLRGQAPLRQRAQYLANAIWRDYASTRSKGHNAIVLELEGSLYRHKVIVSGQNPQAPAPGMLEITSVRRARPEDEEYTVRVADMDLDGICDDAEIGKGLTGKQRISYRNHLPDRYTPLVQEIYSGTLDAVTILYNKTKQ